MFGFSKRRMKIGRLNKVQLPDSISTQGARSPLRPSGTATKKHSTQNNVEVESGMTPPATNGIGNVSASEDTNLQASTAAIKETWMVVSTFGDKPASRSHHAAAVIGSNKMVVVGGESCQGIVNDTQILNLDRLTWAAASPKLYLSPSGLPLKIPTCKGHSLVSWGSKILLVGGKTEPAADKVSVWSFDVETECWSHIEAKGDVPAARGGHSVSKAGQMLILFGGEDTKGRKHNDLHMFDLKSSMWLPLRYSGTGPSPRCDHVASLYDDRILFVFGGKSKSRILNDLYSLDFETLVWSRIKIQGHHPSARAGCRGVICGTKWYIVGGGSKKKRCAETLIFDVLKHEMYVGVASPPASVTINKGFSLVSVNLKDKVFLVAYGGNKKEPFNEIEILIIEKEHCSMSCRTGADKNPSIFDNSCSATSMEFGSHLKRNPPQNSINSSVRHSLASAMEHHHSARRSHSEFTNEHNPVYGGSTSLRKQFHNDGDYVTLMKLQKAIEDDKFEEDNCSQIMEPKNKLPETVVKMDTSGSKANAEVVPTALDMGNLSTYQRHASGSLLSESDNNSSSNNNNNAVPETDGKQTILATTSSMYQFYERKIAPLSRNNVLLEGQLAAALTSRENAEKNLSAAIKTKEETDKRLADTLNEMELLKEKAAILELAQEETNSHSNIVHADNVKLEHDVAFLKAVLDDIQKELHSTRGVLAGERARAFQLQVEVFHLKQRLQSMETLAPTPRKPYPMQ